LIYIQELLEEKHGLGYQYYLFGKRSILAMISLILRDKEKGSGQGNTLHRWRNGAKGLKAQMKPAFYL